MGTGIAYVAAKVSRFVSTAASWTHARNFSSRPSSVRDGPALGVALFILR